MKKAYMLPWAALIFLAQASPSFSQENIPSHEVREMWEGQILSSSYRAGVCLSSMGNVRGVLQLRQSNGQTDIYHFYGKVHNNAIEAQHSSGHRFDGHLMADTVKGVVVLKNGMHLQMEGRRYYDVELAQDDCAPLP